MDERARRLWAGTEAGAIGYGGVAAVARATGMAISTIRKGRDEARAGARPNDVVKVRRSTGKRPYEAANPDVFAAQQQYAVRVNDEFTVDILPRAAGHGWDELKSHITQINLDGVAVKVLDLEGLLKTKEGLRPKDQLDAAAIRRAIDLLKRG